MAVNLGGLVSAEAGELYRRLVTEGPIPLVNVHGNAHVAELDAAGFTTRSPCHPGMVVAVLPEIAFGALLTEFAKSLEASSTTLRAALNDVESWEPDSVDVELLTDHHEVKRTASEVMIHARAEAFEFATSTHDPALTSIDLPLDPIVSAGVRYRVVYARKCLDDPLGRQIVEHSRAAGEEQRFFDGWLTSLRIADDDVALVQITGGALLLRSRAFVAVLRMWFDEVWERSCSPAGPIGLTQGELTVLRMQAAGHKDTAIARAMGCNVRTVRRYVAGILAVLGVDSRFAAGVEAARRGWL